MHLVEAEDFFGSSFPSAFFLLGHHGLGGFELSGLVGEEFRDLSRHSVKVPRVGGAGGGEDFGGAGLL